MKLKDNRIANTFLRTNKFIAGDRFANTSNANDVMRLCAASYESR